MQSTALLKKHKSMRGRAISMCLVLSIISLPCMSQGRIEHDSNAKLVTITDGAEDLSLMIDYTAGCRIREVRVRGKNVISPSGVFTAVQEGAGVVLSSAQGAPAEVTVGRDECRISRIAYGNVEETWTFKPAKEKIGWTIHRTYTKDAVWEDIAFPAWCFADLSTWKGGILDNGGMVWCKYFGVNDTYGVHTAGVTFWNPDNRLALRITPRADGGAFLASKFSKNADNEFVFTQYLTEERLSQRYEQQRFVGGRKDVFNPVATSKKTHTLSIELQAIDYAREYSRGTLPGVDAEAIRELMNTTGRYGVVDNNIIGANGWLTNWKCLHEPFFAQVGMALNDSNYTRNLASTLDQERDLAILEDGRVLSRWHGVAGDEMSGTYNKETGYYEAVWGYTIDSQTGQIINTAELFDLCGDIDWLGSHKQSCEKVLEWLIRRDSNGNGLFEMKNNHIRENKASDWLDIVWAGYENAFVNAQMYEALNLWAQCEEVLGDQPKADRYRGIAARLKASFNKPVTEGGFWYPEKKQYVYWRDEDGEIHGDNLVTPVNFAAIAFGICDDPQRIAAILGEIERRSAAEKLFHWPLCFDSYKREEVQAGNWPFPRYENGDIFPTWGYLGIRSYMLYDPQLALKYINNILEQYKKDGLSSQRYSRREQTGVGSDILSGICTTVTALYRDIYGIRPKWNRMGLEPAMLRELDGTAFSYRLRDTQYDIRLSKDDYEMRTTRFAVKSRHPFGAAMQGDNLLFYASNKEEEVMSVGCKSHQFVELTILDWGKEARSWSVSSAGECKLTWKGDPKATYRVTANGKSVKVETNGKGEFSLSHRFNRPTTFRLSGPVG